MSAESTAVIFIGFQNDYFMPDGVLHYALESSDAVQSVLQNSINLIEQLQNSSVLLINTPIIFTENYAELTDPVGILKTIKEVEAFKKGSVGAQTVSELSQFGERIIEVPGKRGLNAFSNTSLQDLLNQYSISDVILAGAVTSICIDTTGRTAFDLGFHVSILEDCTAGRSHFEQEYYCKEIFPLYAKVFKSRQLLAELS